MRSSRALLALGLIGLAVLVPSTTAVATPSQSSQAMVRQINIARAHYGLRPFRSSPSLNRSARSYSLRLFRDHRFGHMGRIQASGHFHMLGEALAMHAGRRDKVRGTVRAWLRSPPHRAILLNRSMRWVGAGV
jgi:uncharacterized protein YkwD